MIDEGVDITTKPVNGNPLLITTGSQFTVVLSTEFDTDTPVGASGIIVYKNTGEIVPGDDPIELRADTIKI